MVNGLNITFAPGIVFTEKELDALLVSMSVGYLMQNEYNDHRSNHSNRPVVIDTLAFESAYQKLSKANELFTD